MSPERERLIAAGVVKPAAIPPSAPGERITDGEATAWHAAHKFTPYPRHPLQCDQPIEVRASS